MTRSAAVGFVATVGGAAVGIAGVLFALAPENRWLVLLLGASIGATLAGVLTVLVLPAVSTGPDGPGGSVKRSKLYESAQERHDRLTGDVTSLLMEIEDLDMRARLTQVRRDAAIKNKNQTEAITYAEELVEWASRIRQKTIQLEAARRALAAKPKK